MKFSRNPKTGILEVYTDDGRYTGNIYTMGDFVGEDEKSKDKDDREGESEKSEHLKEKTDKSGIYD